MLDRIDPAPATEASGGASGAGGAGGSGAGGVSGAAGSPGAGGAAGGGNGGQAGAKAYALAASDDATCAIRPDGSLWCWGDNADGTLVAGAAATIDAPVRIGDGSDWLAISGHRGRCGLLSPGALRCWGPGGAVPGVETTSTPTEVEPGKLFLSPVGGHTHHCALDTSGALWCWGANAHGQLGLGDTSARTSATQLPGVWLAASVGSAHSCGIRSDKTLWCWGRNTQGQLGFDDMSSRPTPTQVGAGSSWVSLSAGWNHTCAIDASNAAWCWGENAFGEVGTGGTDVQRTPLQVGSFRVVSSGGGVSCAVGLDGTLSCWGRFGQAAQPGQSLVPVQVDANQDWVRVAAGYSHACGVREGVGVLCLGWNYRGQLARPLSVSYAATPLPTGI